MQVLRLEFKSGLTGEKECMYGVLWISWANRPRLAFMASDNASTNLCHFDSILFDYPPFDAEPYLPDCRCLDARKGTPTQRCELTDDIISIIQDIIAISSTGIPFLKRSSHVCRPFGRIVDPRMRRRDNIRVTGNPRDRVGAGAAEKVVELLYLLVWERTSKDDGTWPLAVVVRPDGIVAG
jgi:hypothetical protein